MRQFSVEHREKLRKAKLRSPVRYWLGKKRDKTTNDKIRLSLLGKPLSDTTKLKISKKLKKIGAGKWNKGKLSGDRNPAWKGGKRKHSLGYALLLIPNHHRADKSGYVFEHIAVAEEKIKRMLLADEEVHHINGIKNDNRPENLLVMKKKDHRSLHARRIRRERREDGDNTKI